jgi:hypothetical protein
MTMTVVYDSKTHKCVWTRQVYEQYFSIHCLNKQANTSREIFSWLLPKVNKAKKAEIEQTSEHFGTKANQPDSSEQFSSFCFELYTSTYKWPNKCNKSEQGKQFYRCQNKRTRKKRKERAKNEQLRANNTSTEQMRPFACVISPFYLIPRKLKVRVHRTVRK